MSGSMRWQQVPISGQAGGLAALLRDDNHFFGWVTSKEGKMWIAWAPPDWSNERTSVNIMRDGKYLGLYNNSQDAMDVVRIKCTPNC